MNIFKKRLLLLSLMLVILNVMIFFGIEITGIIISKKLIVYVELWLVIMIAMSVLYRNHKRLNYEILEQLSYISLIPTIFFVAGVLSPATNKKNVGITFLITSAMLIVTFALSAVVLEKKATNRNKTNQDSFGFASIVRYLKSNCAMIIVTVLFAVPRIMSLNNIARWDAGEYTYRLGTACQNFDFTWTSFIENFGLCGHPMYGYAGILAIGEFLFPRQAIGINLVNFVLTCFAFKFLYKMLKYNFKFNNALVITTLLCIIFSPTFFGTSAYFHADYGVAIFFIFVLYFYINKKYLLMAFWACVLCQTKETGVLLYAGFSGAILLRLFITTKGSLIKKVKACLCEKLFLFSLIPGSMYLAYVKLVGGLSGWKQSADAPSSFRWSNDAEATNAFGFNLHYIWVKTKQLFILNFKWIIILLAIIFGAYLIYRSLSMKKQKKAVSISDTNNWIFGVLGALLAYLLFSYLYITAPLIRYNIMWDISLIILVAFMIHKANILSHLNAVKVAIISIIVLAFVAQSYITIDPVSRAMTKSLSVGNMNMMYSARNTDVYLGDFLVYNKQFQFIDKALNEIMKKEFDAKTKILLPDHGSSFFPSGNGAVYKVVWNKKYKYRTMFEDNNTTKIDVITFDEWANYVTKKKLAKKIIYILPPMYEHDSDAILNTVKKKYDVSELKTEHTLLGNLEYYILELKK